MSLARPLTACVAGRSARRPGVGQSRATTPARAGDCDLEPAERPGSPRVVPSPLPPSVGTKPDPRRRATLVAAEERPSRHVRGADATTSSRSADRATAGPGVAFFRASLGPASRHRPEPRGGRCPGGGLRRSFPGWPSAAQGLDAVATAGAQLPSVSLLPASATAGRGKARSASSDRGARPSVESTIRAHRATGATTAHRRTTAKRGVARDRATPSRSLLATMSAPRSRRPRRAWRRRARGRRPCPTGRRSADFSRSAGAGIWAPGRGPATSVVRRLVSSTSRGRASWGGSGARRSKGSRPRRGPQAARPNSSGSTEGADPAIETGAFPPRGLAIPEAEWRERKPRDALGNGVRRRCARMARARGHPTVARRPRASAGVDDRAVVRVEARHRTDSRPGRRIAARSQACHVAVRGGRRTILRRGPNGRSWPALPVSRTDRPGCRPMPRSSP